MIIDKIINFFSKYGCKIGSVYFPLMFASGFYRGTQSMMYYDYKQGKLPNKNELLVNKFATGIYLGSAYITFYGPIAIYQFLGRLEIQLTGKNPYDYEDFYIDMGHHITLRPRQIKKN